MMERVAAIIPVREGREGIKVLLARQRIVVEEKDGYRYKGLPGEWVPVGSVIRPPETEREAAIRALKSAVHPTPRIHSIIPRKKQTYRTEEMHDFGIWDIQYFLASISDKQFTAQGQYSDVRWNTPKNWLAYINSREFEAYAHLTGLPVLKRRRLPTQAIKLLNEL